MPLFFQKMKQNELFLSYGDGDERGFTLRTYDSVVEFAHREFFEHKHSDMEISLITSGRGLYRLKSGVCDIKSGDMFTFGSSQIHCITDVLEGETMRLFNIQFEPTLFWASGAAPLNERHLKLFVNRAEKFSASPEVLEDMRRSISELREETIVRAPGYSIRIYALLMSLIGQLVRASGQEFDENETLLSKSDYSLMRRAMRYMDENLADKLSLSEIAEYAGYNKSYFSTLFTELNGLSPWEYLAIKRIAQAKNLLLSSKRSVTEIANLCGYGNISNFNRQFKRLTGCSPKEFVNRNIQI